MEENCPFLLFLSSLVCQTLYLFFHTKELKVGLKLGLLRVYEESPPFGTKHQRTERTHRVRRVLGDGTCFDYEYVLLVLLLISYIYHTFLIPPPLINFRFFFTLTLSFSFNVNTNIRGIRMNKVNHTLK